MSYNPYYDGQPAGQIPAGATSFPGYPAGSLPPGYPLPNPGRTSPTTEPSRTLYPVRNPDGQYISPPQPYPPGGFGPYPAQQNFSGNLSPLAAGVYPSVPPATGAYSYGQAPGGYSYSPQDLVAFVFEPTENERSKHRLEVKFSPSRDKYVRSSENHQETAGWRRLVYAEQNMQCKVEKDWKMAYLARLENSVAARIEWRFDLTSTGRRVSKLHVQFPVQLYEDGNVNAYVATDRGTLAPLSNSDRSQEVDAARGCQRFSIIAELSRGKGPHAWQHTQLFRQQIKPGFFSTDDSHYPFHVLVEFE